MGASANTAPAWASAQTEFIGTLSLPFPQDKQATSLPSVILPMLREAIVLGNLPPGTRLSEAQLARQLQTSRTPIREALVQLEHEQLVIIAPHIGTCVRPITPHDVEEIYEIRMALETLAVSLIIQRLTSVGKAQISEALAEIKASVTSGNHERYATARDDFHFLLVHLSGNARLEELYTSLIGPIRLLRRIIQRHQGIDESFLHANIRIAEAILSLNRDAPRQMRNHLLKASKRVLAALKSSKTDGRRGRL